MPVEPFWTFQEHFRIFHHAIEISIRDKIFIPEYGYWRGTWEAEKTGPGTSWLKYLTCNQVAIYRPGAYVLDTWSEGPRLPIQSSRILDASKITPHSLILPTRILICSHYQCTIQIHIRTDMAFPQDEATVCLVRSIIFLFSTVNKPLNVCGHMNPPQVNVLLECYKKTRSVLMASSYSYL